MIFGHIQSVMFSWSANTFFVFLATKTTFLKNTKITNLQSKNLTLRFSFYKVMQFLFFLLFIVSFSCTFCFKKLENGGSVFFSTVEVLQRYFFKVCEALLIFKGIIKNVVLRKISR